MKIGCLTWWRNNYGSILQAYALQNFILTNTDNEYEIICQYPKNVGSAQNFMDKLKKIGIKKSIEKVFWKYAVPGLSKRTSANERFVYKYLNVSKEEYNEQTIDQANAHYDAFICGSDQIWNPTLSSGMYRLNFVADTKKRIAYAPSVGVSELPENCKEEYKRDLSAFDSLSCREEAGTKLINALLGENRCTTVLDPTLLVEKTVWDSFTDDAAKVRIDDKYIFVYLLRGTKQERFEIEKFAKAHGLKVITIPFLEADHVTWYDFKFGDYKIWEATPADFVSLIRHAQFVVTDSFHSSVFSSIYHIPFACFPKIGKTQMGRILSLHKMLKIDGHIVTNYDELCRAYENPIDWDAADKVVMDLRRQSRKYLLDAVNE